MMNSIIPFLAQILAPVYIVTAILLLFRPKLFDAVMDDFMKSPALSFFSGMVVLIIGTMWMLAIFSWANFTEGVFTIFGILAFVKGILLLVYPELLWKMVYKFPVFKMTGALIAGVLGIWFLSLGYNGLF